LVKVIAKILLKVYGEGDCKAILRYSFTKVYVLPDPADDL